MKDHDFRPGTLKLQQDNIIKTLQDMNMNEDFLIFLILL